MSNVEHYARGLRPGIRNGSVELMDRLVRARDTAGSRDHRVPGGMPETAENLRRDYDITREEQDESPASPSNARAPPTMPADSSTSSYP
jgi:acetyl-CoA C-acetyltransferase